MTGNFLIFYVTHPDEATARRIADALLQDRLIACANVFPMSSAYWWEGSIVREGEWVSVLKTSLLLEAEVEAAIARIHPYQTPCLMRFEARANQAYCDWIAESTRDIS
jgi:periplasmic divalent cation tolerance protein